MTILDQLADHARERVVEAKKKIPLEKIKRQALSMPKGNFAFENALKKPGICGRNAAQLHQPVARIETFRVSGQVQEWLP